LERFSILLGKMPFPSLLKLFMPTYRICKIRR